MGPKAINKEEIDCMIQRAVSAAVEAASAQLTADFTARYDAKIEEIVANCDAVKSENIALQQQVDSLKSSLENSESKINSLNKESIDQRKLISELENKIHTCLKWANQNEQYSRRNNIKITGLKTSENEDTRLSVCNFLKDKLGIKSKAGDIDAAHILPKGINQKGQKR